MALPVGRDNQTASGGRAQLARERTDFQLSLCPAGTSPTLQGCGLSTLLPTIPLISFSYHAPDTLMMITCMLSSRWRRHNFPQTAPIYTCPVMGMPARCPSGGGGEGFLHSLLFLRCIYLQSRIFTHTGSSLMCYATTPGLHIHF